MATGSLVCAIVGVFIFQPVLGTIAIVLGLIARRNMRRSNNFDGYGRALAGIIIGVIEIAITAALIYSFTVFMNRLDVRPPDALYRVGTGFSPR